jgi:hypothetical protein
MTSSFESANPRRPPLPLWRRLSLRQVLLFAGLLLAGNVLFYLFAVAPLGARDAQQQALIESLERQVEARKAEVEKLRVISGKVARARTEGDELVGEITLRRRTTYSKLLAELITSAQQSGIESRESNFEIEPVDGSEQYAIVTVTANFRGQYENLVRLLNRLDRSELFLIIGSLGATPRSESNELQIVMKIDTFVRNSRDL